MPPKFEINDAYFTITDGFGNIVMEGNMSDFKTKELKFKKEEENNYMEKFNLEKHWDEFKLGKLAVNCKTKDLSDEFIKYCNIIGIRWGSGASLTELNYWESYGADLCYSYHGGMSNSGLNYYKNEEYKITEFTGFDSLLKTKLPTTTTKETIEIICHGKETIVLIKDNGRYFKGVSRCHYEDTYDKRKGFEIALERAMENKYGKHTIPCKASNTNGLYPVDLTREELNIIHNIIGEVLKIGYYERHWKEEATKKVSNLIDKISETKSKIKA